MSNTDLADKRVVRVPSDAMVPLARLRRWIANRVTDLSDDHLVDLLLVANALVSNAYRHAQAPHRVRLRRLHDRVRVEVDDGSPGRLPILGRPRARGRGLLLVNRISSHWGFEQGRDHKTVWAEVPAP